MSTSLKLAREFLGKKIEVNVDRPLGSKHPKHGFLYEVNYGFVPNTKSSDGEELDAYYLGLNKPIKKAQGVCIAIIHMTNDDDDKLIVVPDEKKDISDEEIEKEVEFQEKFFEHVIVREDPSHVLQYKEKLPHRKGVVGIIINEHRSFLITQLHGYGKNDWRFAGGGVDEGETHEEALLRELKEELGSDKFEIIKESMHVNRYDWPDWLIAQDQVRKNRLYRGQEQKQFLVNFSGEENEIIIQHAELIAAKWVKVHELRDHFNFKNQWKGVKIVLEEFGLV